MWLYDAFVELFGRKRVPRRIFRVVVHWPKFPLKTVKGAQNLEKMRFLQNSTTSEILRKFSRRRGHMFRVSRRSARFRAFERTNFYGHTMHRRKNFADFRFFWRKKNTWDTFLNLTFLINKILIFLIFQFEHKNIVRLP